MLDGTGTRIEPFPPAGTEGARLTVEVVREAIPEPGRAKMARVAASDEAPRSAPAVEQRVTAMGGRLRQLPPTGPDLLEQAGWAELLDEVARGDIAFRGDAHRSSLTHSMTKSDVDRDLPPEGLSRAGGTAENG